MNPKPRSRLPRLSNNSVLLNESEEWEGKTLVINAPKWPGKWNTNQQRTLNRIISKTQFGDAISVKKKKRLQITDNKEKIYYALHTHTYTHARTHTSSLHSVILGAPSAAHLNVLQQLLTADFPKAAGACQLGRRSSSVWHRTFEGREGRAQDVCAIAWFLLFFSPFLLIPPSSAIFLSSTSPSFTLPSASYSFSTCRGPF